jgi:NADH-quinone oxidoreductase subunit A
MSLSLYIFGVFVVVSVMLSSYFLGERSFGHERAGIYESGIKGFGLSRPPFFAHYFLLAILFVIFDMESAFLYLWSSSIRELGWPGFIKMAFFIGMLVLGLVYAFRLGVLDLVKSIKKEL